MSPPRVSVVIVNWNRLDDIRETLRSLEKVRGPSFEVIVVDNGSTDGSAEALAGIVGVRAVLLPENLGPASARNEGLKVARGEYVFFLDSDASLARPCLRRLVERMDRDSTVGIIGCRIMSPFTRKLDQWIYAEPAETHARREFETYSFSAAGAIVRAEALRQVGGFWDSLFIYNEELDLSIRVLRAGYRILYAPDARVYHRASPQGRGRPRMYWYYQIRNQIWIFYRYYPWTVRWRKVAVYSGVYAVKGLANRQLGACLSGIAAGVGNLAIIGRYRDKMTVEEYRRLEALNRRTSIRLTR